MEPVWIDEIIADCVAKASAIVLRNLIPVDPNITGVHFQHGHPLEIIEILQGLTNGTTSKTQRYPLFALFRDFPERKGILPGVYAEVSLNMIIATRTEPDYDSNKRKIKSFKPILYPILGEFLNQINLSGMFLTEGDDTIEFTQIDHYFWGRESIYGAKANIFNDWIDCIELKNFILKPYIKNC